MRTAAFALLLVISLPLQAQSIDEFFDQFTTEWVRGDPNLATYLRYFEGEEQDRMDRQLTPGGRAYALERIALAKGGLEQLREFDRSQLTDINRVSADLLDWQLQAMVDREPFLDFGFPLNHNLLEGRVAASEPLHMKMIDTTSVFVGSGPNQPPLLKDRT